jgi:hypothetical protein
MAQKSNDLQFECSTAGTVCIIRFETLRSAESLHPLPLLAVHPISLTARSRKKPRPNTSSMIHADFFQKTNIPSTFKTGGISRSRNSWQKHRVTHYKILVRFWSPRLGPTITYFLNSWLPIWLEEQISMWKRLRISAGIQNTAPSYGSIFRAIGSFPPHLLSQTEITNCRNLQ